MRTWMHSHNLKQTTRDRLNSVLGELEAERANLETPGQPRSADEQEELHRVDKALSLLQAAVGALGG